MTKILIVDDDAHIRELINLLLRKEGFDLYEASDGLQALKVMEKVKIDLAVIDIMMPNMDGWQLCKELREFSDIPILMLTAKGETTQKVKGFGLGADDYLVKPFEPIELVLRIKALLKRYKITISQTLNIGELKMNRNTHEISFKELEYTIPLKEFELLFKLASYPGKTFSRKILSKTFGAMIMKVMNELSMFILKECENGFQNRNSPSGLKRFGDWATVWR